MQEKKFYWADTPSQWTIAIAKPAYPLIAVSVFITLVFALLHFTLLTLWMLVVTISIGLFFRDPDRAIPKEEGGLVSPADGKIIFVGEVDDNRFLNTSCLKVSIFMSVFNVHINRIPYDGEVEAVLYYPGSFVSANLDKASQFNEHNAVILKLAHKKISAEAPTKIAMVQIAGLIARRIICGIQKNDKVSRGSRFGMICFGSRVDLYLPSDFKPNVEVGSKVRAGSSIIGYLKS